jgi:hypothetical protein
MPAIVNWELLKNPFNWIVVALMLAIATFALCLILDDGHGHTGFQHMTGSAGV